MNNNSLKKEPYIKELIQLDKAYKDRLQFHELIKPVLVKMGADIPFLKRVIARNFKDPGFLNFEWSRYNIPFFYIYETNDFVLKIHLFPGAENFIPGIAAHAIHHHNNFILTTNAFYGSGYESILFDKEYLIDQTTNRANLRINKHFHQKDWNPSTVDAWEPHVVFIPELLSATIVIWTPDKKRITDRFRNMYIFKSLKTPLRSIIRFFGLTNQLGIASNKTHQFYPSLDGIGYMLIEEDEYFAPTRLDRSESAREYSLRILFSFLQKAGLVDKQLFRELMENEAVPAFYRPWFEKILSDVKIEESFHATEINIPQRSYNSDDILSCSI